MKYAIRPHNWYYWECDQMIQKSPVPISTVSDHVARDTGLLDSKGNKIWRLPERVGF